MRKRMKKRIVSCILTLAMVFSLVPVSTKQAFASPLLTILDGKIFANGNAIIFEAGSNTNYTNIYIDVNRNGALDDGQTPIDLNGSDYFNSTLDGDTSTGFDLSNRTIYGGSNENSVEGDTKITVLSGNIYRIIGGGYSSNTTSTANVTGNTNIDVTGGTVDTINGGGVGSAAHISGNTNITLKGGDISLILAGGIEGACVGGSTNVLAEGDARITNICGGGTGGGKILSSTNIIINGGNVKDIYLGGAWGSITSEASSASAIISGGTVTNIYKGDVSGSAQLSYTGGTITGSVDSKLIKPVTFTELTANGASGTSPTTELTLTFSEDPISLTASNITVTGATKGTLSGTGTIRTLNISDITVGNGENVTVTVATPAAFTITPASKTVTVYKYIPTLTDITLTPTAVEYVERDVAGTKVADLAVVGTPTTGITYTLDGSGTHDSLFQIAGSELQIKSGTKYSTITYIVRIKAYEDAQPSNTVNKEIKFTPIIQDTTPPKVTSIIRKTPSAEKTNAISVTYTVNFSENVEGVDITDFTLTTTETATGTIAAVLTSSVSAIDVTVNRVAGQGTLRLNLKDSGTGIKDAAGNAISGGFTGGETYTIDRIAPTVTSIIRQTPSEENTNATSVTYRVTFSESVSGVDTGDFTFSTNLIHATGYSIASVSSASGSVIDVTVNTGNDGIIRLNLKDSRTGIKDAAGNAISGGFTGGQIYTIDRIAPTVSSITRQTSSEENTNASSVTYTVNFSENVDGVDITDFTLTTTETAAGSIASVSSASGSAIDVTVDKVAGQGTLRLDLKDSGTGITDTVGNAISGGFTEGKIYTVDQTAPTVTSITRQTPSAENTNASSVTYTVNFSENVEGVDITDFTLTTTETAKGSIASVSSAKGNTIDVTVESVTGQGTLRLDLNASGTGIKDAAGNAISGGFTGGQTYTVDLVAPTVISIIRQNPSAAVTSASSGSLTYRVTFSEIVTGVGISDFTLDKTGTADASIASIDIVSGSAIDVTVNSVTGDGTLRLDLYASETGITDSLGNAITGGYTGGQTYTVDRTAPTLTAGAVSRTSDTSATVKFTSSEAGKYYYVVAASGSAQPTIDTSGAGANCAAAENTISLSTLSAGAKDIYIVVKDTADHVSVDTFKISIPAYVAPSSNGGASSITGTVQKEQRREAGAPTADLQSSTEELKKIFTASELAKMEAGENAKVILKVNDISATVSEEEKKQIAEKLEKDAAVLYVDLSLYKQVGTAAETRVTETSEKIKISLEVPEELWNLSGDTNRTYRVIRIHNGVTDILEGTYDPVTHLFTFETDRFSTYALTYQDEKKATANDKPQVYNDFHHLRLTAKAAETSQTLSFTKVSGADGYLIYGASYGEKNKLKKLGEVSDTVLTFTHKKLKKASYYKYQVKAYQIVDGKKVILATSKEIYSVTKGKTYANPTKVTSEVSSVSIAVGKTKSVTCKAVLPKNTKMKKYAAAIRYETTNKDIATVDKTGKIKAQSKGTCYVYAYAQNGVYKKIKVTVK